MITFQRERGEDFARDAEGLWQEHWEEVRTGEEELRLHLAHYLTLEALGQLMIVTARADAELVGYVVLVVRKHSRYDMLCAFEDGFFVAKPHRGIGHKLLQAAELFAGGRGVKRMIFSTRGVEKIGKMYARLGFAPIDELWSKDL